MSTSKNTTPLTMHMTEDELDALVKGLESLDDGHAAKRSLPYLKGQLDCLARKNRAQEWQAQLKRDGRCSGCERLEYDCICDELYGR
jgi:hypothetical protein